MGWFCPDSFVLSEKSREFARKRGLTDEQIEDQLEAMRDWEFQKKRTDWDRVFRNWIRKGLEWGQITPPPKHHKPEQVTPQQRQKDIEAWERDMQRLGVRVMKR